jgi:hypothetical protein
MPSGTNIFNNDVIVNGHFTPKTMTLPDDTVTDRKIPAGANLSAEKMEQQYQPVYSQGSNTTAVADPGQVKHIVQGATGVLREVIAGCVVANIGDSTVSVDVKKNGTTVLSAPISLTSSHTARQVVTGVLSVVGGIDLVEDDVLEVVVTVSAGTGTLGKGVFCGLNIREQAD